jgi:hypothetical protein
VQRLNTLRNNIKYILLENEAATEICRRRRKEGWFINESLMKMKEFITWTLVNSSGNKNLLNFPPFINQCVLLQCNPYFKDCFGLNSNEIKKPKSYIIENLFNKIGSSDDIVNNLNICIFNVINLSQISANNPPPTPYVDVVNELIYELQKIENQYIYTDNFEKDKLNVLSKDYKVNDKYLKKLEKSLGIIEADEDVNLNKQYLLPAGSLDDIASNPNVNTFEDDNYQIKENIFDSDFIQKVKGYISRIRTGTEVAEALKGLINILSISNSVTTLGTMTYIDMMSKFGSNYIDCKYCDMSKYDNVSPEYNKYVEYINNKLFE